VLDGAAILELQAAVRAVKVDRRIGRYLVDLADATRHHASLKMGCSPRATLSLFRIAQARAFVSGRDYAIPEDAKAVAGPTLAHRLALDTKAKYAGVLKEDVVREILDRVPVGV
jgi:MoxR-like ATPase